MASGLARHHKFGATVPCSAVTASANELPCAHDVPTQSRLAAVTFEQQNLKGDNVMSAFKEYHTHQKYMSCLMPDILAFVHYSNMQTLDWESVQVCKTWFYALCKKDITPRSANVWGAIFYFMANIIFATAPSINDNQDNLMQGLFDYFQNTVAPKVWQLTRTTSIFEEFITQWHIAQTMNNPMSLTGECVHWQHYVPVTKNVMGDTFEYLGISVTKQLLDLLGKMCKRTPLDQNKLRNFFTTRKQDLNIIQGQRVRLYNHAKYGYPMSENKLIADNVYNREAISHDHPKCDRKAMVWLIPTEYFTNAKEKYEDIWQAENAADLLINISDTPFNLYDDCMHRQSRIFRAWAATDLKNFVFRSPIEKNGALAAWFMDEDIPVTDTPPNTPEQLPPGLGRYCPNCPNVWDGNAQCDCINMLSPEELDNIANNVTLDNDISEDSDNDYTD